MPYKTIVLELLQEHPALYERLRSGRMLLTAMESHAADLRSSHLDWMDRLRRENPASAPAQTASEAMEYAVQELRDRLQGESMPSEPEAFSLDAAMNYIRRHTPTA
jgi:hypothetical protein